MTPAKKSILSIGILTVIVVALSLALGLFNGRGPDKAQASGSVSLYARCYRHVPNPGWLGGNCKGYNEGDWVVEELKISNGTDSAFTVTSANPITMAVDYFDSHTNAIGFDGIRGAPAK